MLININSMSCSKDMKRITFFAWRILRFAANNPGRFNEESFLDRFGQDGKWFLELSKKNKDGTYGDVRAGLEGIFELDISDRKRIKKAFVNDVMYTKYINDEKFKFITPMLPPSLIKVLSNFLVPFYEKILRRPKGYELVGLDINNFSRKHLIEGYRKDNSQNARVCPVCMGHLQKDKKKNKKKSNVYVEIDHYFPKNKYPILSVFADNLMPVCEICNGPSCKHEEDPIDIHGEGCLLRVFIPYHRNAINDIDIEFVDEEVHIIPVNLSDKYTQIRINNLEKLYHLESRWSGELEHISDSIFAKMEYESKLNQELIRNNDCFLSVLKSVSDGICPRSWTFLASKYLGWLIKDKERVEALRLDESEEEIKKSITSKRLKRKALL